MVAEKEEEKSEPDQNKALFGQRGKGRRQQGGKSRGWGGFTQTHPSNQPQQPQSSCGSPFNKSSTIMAPTIDHSKENLIRKILELLAKFVVELMILQSSDFIGMIMLQMWMWMIHRKPWNHEHK